MKIRATDTSFVAHIFCLSRIEMEYIKFMFSGRHLSASFEVKIGVTLFGYLMIEKYH